jgi:hypothetical protein
MRTVGMEPGNQGGRRGPINSGAPNQQAEGAKGRVVLWPNEKEPRRSGVRVSAAEVD